MQQAIINRRNFEKLLKYLQQSIELAQLIDFIIEKETADKLIAIRAKLTKQDYFPKPVDTAVTNVGSYKFAEPFIPTDPIDIEPDPGEAKPRYF